jgi:acyl-CoA reductase-like NAD-dependent aldehyde dehydrogenase
VDRKYRMLVGGEFVEGVGSFEVVNPATGKPFARCPKADDRILDAAVQAAQRAFPEWAPLRIEDRAESLLRLADRLEAETESFARVLTQEQGKPRPHAAFEVSAAVKFIRVFASFRLPEKVLRDEGGVRIVEHRTPLGVVAAITPWNFPVMLLAQKLAPALLAGNTLVAKPAPTTPLTTLMIGELCRDVLPPGVVNTICDQNDLGGALVAHPGVAKISFTGSTETGKKVMAAAAAGLKRLTLELGGNDAAIVLDDVNVSQIAGHVFRWSMANAGQICAAIKRVYVPASLYDEFCDALATIAQKTIVDDGERQGVEMGPIQNRTQFEKLTALLRESRQVGRVIAGGKALSRDGYFIAPTIVRDISDDARLVREEQFGPVLPVLKYDDLDEVITRVNASPYGLAGSVWGSDVLRATAVAMKMDTGTVWVNHFGLDPTIPFRGAKQSGVGAELGLEGLYEYTQPHIVSVRSLESS